MANQLARQYDEAQSWGRGDLDPEERDAAIVICGRAWYRMDAKRLLTVCGLLRKPSLERKPLP